MKIFYRTLIILVAAVLVFGATFAVTQLDSVQTLLASAGSEHHGERPRGDFPQTAATGETGAVAVTLDPTTATNETTTTAATGSATQSTQPSMSARPEGGGHNGNLLGIVEVVKNFVIVLGVTLIVAIPWSITQRIQRLRRPLRAAQATGAA